MSFLVSLIPAVRINIHGRRQHGLTDSDCQGSLEDSQLCSPSQNLNSEIPLDRFVRLEQNLCLAGSAPYERGGVGGHGTCQTCLHWPGGHLVPKAPQGPRQLLAHIMVKEPKKIKTMARGKPCYSYINHPNRNKQHSDWREVF